MIVQTSIPVLFLSHGYFSQCERKARALGNFDSAVRCNDRVCGLERKLEQLHQEVALELLLYGTVVAKT